MDSLQDNIKLTEKGDSFEEAFFILQRDWNNLNTTKELKAIKDKFFHQHGVRSAYPDCSLTTPEETAELAKDFSDKELCFALASHNKMNEFDHLKSFITTDFSSFDKIIVWHGWSASELLLLYLMSVLIKENLFQLTII